MSSQLIPIFKEFRARLADIGRPVVAGGAVRDHLMGRTAKDYDIFLLGTRFDADTRKAVVEALSDLEVIKPLEWHNSEPYLVTTVRWGGVDVQVMCNPAANTAALVETFDWNVCLFAFDGAFYQAEDIKNIGPGKTLRLQVVRFPLSTLRRGFRFSERFLMQMDREVVVDLCRRVWEKQGDSGPHGAIPDMPSLSANVLVEDV